MPASARPGSGSNVLGVEDVQFIDGVLYGMEAGAGCSHGLAGTDNTIFRVNADGTTTTVVDLSAFLKAHPVANPSLDDFEPDGTLSTIATDLTFPTAMIFNPAGDALYVSNNGFTPGPGAGQIVRIAIE